MSVDPFHVADIIAEIAEAEITPRFGKLSPEEIRSKSGPNDLVTEVDEVTEKVLRRALLDVRPDAGFIGEEEAAANPQSVEVLKGDGAFWVVDPLDGTRNFVRGVEEFATIVALVENGRTIMGWIYGVPDKKCAVAVEGGGAYWGSDKIVPSAPAQERLTALRSIGWLQDDVQEALRATLKANFASSASHCSAYAYLNLSMGAVDLKVSSRIHPWDHAAGALLLAEAGGAAAYLDDGSPYLPAPSVDRALLAAAPGRDIETLRGILGS